MAEDKKPALSPLELLEKQHAKDSADRRAEIAAATKDLRDAEQMVRELKSKVGDLQQKNLAASLGYDTRRAELLAQAKPKAA